MLEGNTSFIEIYDNLLSQEECDRIITAFENSPDVDWGKTSGGFDFDYKKCKEISRVLHESDEIGSIIGPHLSLAVQKYDKKYKALEFQPSWNLYPRFNIQKYEGEDDGYKLWHSEHGSTEVSSQRVLAWMIYLNNANSGTKFMYYPDLKSKRGRCAIWPSGWQHLHRGVLPNKGIKYIATGWVSFDR